MQISRETIEKIITKATLAPSGDNSQPWKFRVEGDTIYIINIPEKDISLFNFEQTSNYIAIGCALENLHIAASAAGYRPVTTLFPTSDATIVSSTRLEEGTGELEDLDSSIATRASNRRTYKPTPLDEKTLAMLMATVSEQGLSLRFVTRKEQIDRVAHAASAGEKIALENRNIHDFLFQHVTWTKKDDESRHGFYIKTFEFKPPQEALFKLFRNWDILSFFSKFGITDFIASDMEGVYRSSAAFGSIAISDRSPESLVNAGRVLERVWLMLTKLGLSMQMTSSVSLLALPLLDGATSELSAKHQKLVLERSKVFTEVFGVDPQEKVALVFRFGYAEKPSSGTTRFAPIIEYSS